MTTDHTIPDAAVKAAGEALKRYMVGDDYDLERVPPDVPSMQRTAG